MPLLPKPYQWPAGKRCAVVISADVDAESPLLWKSRGKTLHTLGELEQRRFGPREGLARILALLGEYGISGSFYVPGYVAEAHPEILPGLLAGGHEVGLHGYHHELVHQLEIDENRDILLRCLKVFEDQIGKKPLGYRSPAWEMTESMMDLLQTEKLIYDSSLMGYDHPYTLGGVTEIPVQWLLDDAIYFRYFGSGIDHWHPADPGAVLNGWIEEFEGLRKFGGLFMVTVHPWISGRAQRIRLLEKLIRHIRQYNDVWWATALEIANYHGESANRNEFEESISLPSTDF